MLRVRCCCLRGHKVVEAEEVLHRAPTSRARTNHGQAQARKEPDRRRCRGADQARRSRFHKSVRRSTFQDIIDSRRSMFQYLVSIMDSRRSMFQEIIELIA